jgi:hypothetical protein
MLIVIHETSIHDTHLGWIMGIKQFATLERKATSSHGHKED